MREVKVTKNGIEVILKAYEMRYPSDPKKAYLVGDYDGKKLFAYKGELYFGYKEYNCDDQDDYVDFDIIIYGVYKEMSDTDKDWYAKRRVDIIRYDKVSCVADFTGDEPEGAIWQKSVMLRDSIALCIKD